ncbi:phage major capsid protein [Roseospira visakhapatnamensis]|uniref:HK97 family phage major capsid protein/HK97 family phage prohead protease n=1 Tax=Roseospira visakhapatnamensis TaxID=390880 RepID=A0A7W6W8V0_9PROT|nr:phage major capsid protein [Roseospira visakhapatnamensis]MBB4264801.1 HK97 family phage major capsid protein/HK97 family phage prohead protease [Roseospira visakhapatnamensis]
MPDIELRFAPTLGAEGTFRGLASAYGVLDQHGTAFGPGAFSASLAETRADARKVPLLLHHDATRVCGVVETLTDTPDGLEIEGRFVLDTRDGAEAHALAKAGALALSVGFKRVRDQPRAGGGRTITAARLAEVSCVAVASNPKTRITEVRSTAARAAQQKESAMDANTEAAPETRADETSTEPGDLSGRVSALETRVEGIANDVSAIKASVTKTEARADRLEARAGRAGVTATPANDAPGIETRAFDTFIRRGREALGAEEIRSLHVADDTSGGYLTTPDFRADLLKGLQEISPIRRLAAVTSTSAGEIVLPKLTTRPTAVWVSEIGARTGTEPAFGQVRIPVHEASVYVDVSTQLLEDAAINVSAELSNMLATEYARLEGVAFLSGDGTGKPSGILTSADLVTMANGSTTVLSADALIGLLYSLKPTYRARGSWIMNPSTIATVRKMKASDGHYLWQDGLAAGQPATFLGFPVAEAADMPEIASGAVPVLFGDWKTAYRVVTRAGVSILRDPYTQATNGLTRFHSRMRVGGALTMPEAAVGLTMATS